jgi:DNA repair exonuclease SbcCD ATPase subunit
MKLEITGFKCYTQAEFDLVDGQLLLLKGPSGKGKSTILQALSWVLYGQMRGIDNHWDKKGKLQVILTFNNMTILRKKRPNLLQVSESADAKSEIETTIYEDKVAQELINRRFGLPELWSSISYISQGQKNGLLSSSNSTKMDILNQISFSGDDPDFFTDAIDQKIKEEKTIYSQAEGAFGERCNTLNKFLAENQVNTGLKCSEETIAQYQTLLQTDKIKIQQLRGQLSQYHRLVGAEQSREQRLQVLLKSISELNIGLINVDTTSLEIKISELQSSINNSREVNQLTQRSKMIQGKMIKPTTQGTFTQQDYHQVSHSHSVYQRNSQLAQGLGLEYKQEPIDIKIKEFSDILEAQKQLHLFQEVELLEINLSKSRVEPVDQQQILELQNQIRIMEQGRSILTCPHCNGGVRYMGGKLNPSDSLPVEPRIIEQTKYKLQELQSKQQAYNHYQQLQTKYDSMKRVLPNSKPSYNMLTQQQQQTMQGFVQQMRGIQIVNLPIHNPIEIKQVLDYQQLKLELDSVNRQLGNRVFCDVQELQTQLNQIRKQVQDTQREQVKSDHLMSEKLKLETLETAIPDHSLPQTVKNLEENIAQQELTFIGSKNANYVIKSHGELTSAKTALELKRLRLTNLHKLRQIATKVECDILQNTVDTINNVISDVITRLFEDPITVTLKLFKEMKSTKKIKPQVNLSIQYKGGEFDNISQLSGGEGDRVSLAITLALNRISGGSILLLDESLSSLDTHVKELCLECIRSHTEGKTVICVNHEGVDGHYDLVYNL